MAVKHNRITIVGCGPGAAEYLTAAAIEAMRAADVLIGSRRLLELAAGSAGRKIAAGADVAATLRQIALHHPAEAVAVLVSGDCGLCSLASRVVARFGRDACVLIPGVSSVQVAFARLALDWTAARIVSAHGRTPRETPQDLAACDTVAVLAGTREALAWAAEAAEAMRATHEAFLCQDLTLESERVRRVTARKLASAKASSLSIVVLVRKAKGI